MSLPVAPASRLPEFSWRTREAALRRFRQETFDLLVVGGGITGTAVARDAATRGLRVALVEKHDFAFGTSSRSSKLIHGGLRYLERFELGLVFEALAERAFLLRSAPHLVRPLPFYLPVYKGDRHGPAILDLGLWLYDLLALFRTPGFHRRLSARRLLAQIPALNPEGLRGGFKYFDASMWDDALAVETARAAVASGAAVASYVEALGPLWRGERAVGMRVRDREAAGGPGGGEAELDLRAKRVVVCAGPWTDQVAGSISGRWNPWINPSKGVHVLFDLKRLPVPGAMTMSNPEDGRVAFAIGRPDFGAGVTIVGTTDGATPLDPEKAAVEPGDIQYLLRLLNRYFPALKLVPSDILSAYVGVRPLFGAEAAKAVAAGTATAASLQKVSREHHIDVGPGGSVVVAGGKYTTHRTMAREIVDFTLKTWPQGDRPTGLVPPRTRAPVNPAATLEAVLGARREAESRGVAVPEALYSRYGAEALAIASETAGAAAPRPDPEGFPLIEAQLRHAMRSGMVVHLEDFYLRRVPLYSSRHDHGDPWAERLAAVWAEERALGPADAARELERLRAELGRRSAWKASL